MREKPRDQAESPQEQYDRLLQRGISVQKSYEALNDRISKLYDDGDENEAERASDEREQFEDSITHLLKQRVELVREMENLKNIEDVFPRVKRAPLEETSKVDAAELIRMFNSGKIGVDDIRAAGEKMKANQPEELTDDELNQFYAVRAELAREYGYDVEGDRWLDLKRNGVAMQLAHFAFPSENGITGEDRISKMWVSVLKDGKKTGAVLNYDRGWDVAPTDPEVQKEIDRAIAIFG
jgi:hypothetical protein